MGAKKELKRISGDFFKGLRFGLGGPFNLRATSRKTSKRKGKGEERDSKKR